MVFRPRCGCSATKRSKIDSGQDRRFFFFCPPDSLSHGVYQERTFVRQFDVPRVKPKTVSPADARIETRTE